MFEVMAKPSASGDPHSPALLKTSAGVKAGGAVSSPAQGKASHRCCLTETVSFPARTTAKLPKQSCDVQEMS